MDRAQYNIRNLIEVVPFLKAESEFYGAVVLAIYFCEKYENAGEVAAEDTALITEYENIVLGGFDAWLAKQGITEHREVVMTLYRAGIRFVCHPRHRHSYSTAEYDSGYHPAWWDLARASQPQWRH